MPSPGLLAGGSLAALRQGRFVSIREPLLNMAATCRGRGWAYGNRTRHAALLHADQPPMEYVVDMRQAVDALLKRALINVKGTEVIKSTDTRGGG